MKHTIKLLLIILAIGLSSFHDPYWHAFFTVKNQTQFKLLVEMDQMQNGKTSVVNVIIPSNSSRVIYDEYNIIAPMPEEVFDELRMKVMQEETLDNFCTFNNKNNSRWKVEYEMFNIYYSLAVNSTDDEYKHNTKMNGTIISPR